MHTQQRTHMLFQFVHVELAINIAGVLVEGVAREIAKETVDPMWQWGQCLVTCSMYM